MLIVSTVKRKSHELARAEPEFVAPVFGTIPKYVRVNNNATVDLLEEWVERDVAEENIDFVNFYGKVSKIFPNVPEKEVLQLWLARNTILKTDPNVLFYAQLQVQGMIDIQTFLEYDASDFLALLETQKAHAKKAAEKIAESAQKLGTGIPHTPFVPRSKTFKISINISVALNVLFDNATPSKDVPLIAYAGMYKYAPNFVPVQGMDVTSPDAVIVSRKSSDEFERVFVYAVDARLEVEFTTKLEENEADVARVIMSIMGLQNISSTMEQTSVQGFYFFLGYTVEKYTFADFIMNNEIAASYFSLGEFRTVAKKTASMRIYCHNPKVTAVFSDRKMQPSHIDNKYVGKLLSEGDNYIRVFVTRSQSDADSHKFIELLAKILDLYYREYPSIYKIYKTYIPSFVRQSLSRKYSTPDRVSLDSDIFFPNYSRLCPHAPTPLDDDETAEHSIEFPRESGKRYTCDDPVYKYPGVRENTLDNAEKYPYIPCCFKTDQKSKPKFMEYYGLKKTGHATQIRMITTTKPLNPNFFGVLPENVNNVLVSINPGKAYVRYGVAQRTQSFLDCVSLAVNRKIRRENIPNLVNVAVCCQENPGQSIDTIKKLFTDATQYLDPRRSIRALEEVFGVNIFVFDMTTIVSPNHVQGFYRYKKKTRPVVLIFEHTDIRQCELISEWTIDTTEYLHEHNQRMTPELEKVFDLTYETYAGEFPVKSIPRPEFLDRCVSQYVDMYGKLRGAFIEMSGGTVFIETSPLAPLNVPLGNKVDRNNSISETEFTNMYGKYLRDHDDFYVELPKKSSDALEQAQKNMRAANYVSEVFLYMYSVWESRGSADLTQFVNENTAIIPGYVYNISGPRIEDTKSVLVDGKLACTSATMIERLIFVLRRELINNPARIEEYRQKKYIENYYESIDSFKTGNFLLATSLPVAQPQTKTYSPCIIPEKSDYIVKIDAELFHVTSVSSIPSDCELYIYNSEDQIVKLKGTQPAYLVYKHNDVKHYCRLENY